MYSVRFIAPHYILDPSSLYVYTRVFHSALGISIIRRGISYRNVKVNTTMSSVKVFHSYSGTTLWLLPSRGESLIIYPFTLLHVSRYIRFRILGATFILNLFHGFYPTPPVFSRFIGEPARQPIFKQTPRSKRSKFH